MADKTKESVTIKQNKKEYNRYEVKMTVTLGKIEAMENALREASSYSPVASDLLVMISQAKSSL